MDKDAQRVRMLARELGRTGDRPDLAALREFVPDEWVSRTSVGLDGVVRVSLPGTREPVPEEVGTLLDPLVGAFAGQRLGGDQALEALAAAHRLGAAAEAAALHATRELAARTGEDQLRLKGVADPGELSRTARERWRTGCKTLAATETAVLTGAGKGTARERVAISMAPAACRRAVDQGLGAGLARMDLVAAWWRRCARMPHEQGGAVARALFGTDAPAEEVAVERLTPEGEISSRPWARKEFYQALEREALRQEGRDPAAQERDRRARHERRDAYAVVDEDGTAQIVITGDALSATGALGRLAGLAHKARSQGDPRTERQLRCDIAHALLQHGVLPLPDLGEDPDLITPHDITKLVDVLAGVPAHEVQVVVPWDVLTGTAALPAPVNPSHQPQTPPPRPAPEETDPGAAPAPGPASQTDPDPAAAPGPARAGPPTDRAGPPTDRLEGVGQVLGRYGRYLSAAEVRRIAGRPGTTFYRLLTDHADGRCLERSIKSYAPDAAMRAQLRAADVVSRAPGSTVAACDSQLDHVQEYLLKGGPTSELNLQTLDVPFHALKTQKFWHAEMDASRNITWTSFWGRLYRTRPWDYRQYFSRTLGAPPGNDPPGASAGGAEDEQLVDRRYLASLLVYSALAHRDPGGRLEADDDDPDSAWILGLREAVELRRTTSSGRKRTGPRPGTPDPEQLLATDPQLVLDHADWVEAVKEATAQQAADQDADHDDGAPAEPSTDDDDTHTDPPPPF